MIKRMGSLLLFLLFMNTLFSQGICIYESFYIKINNDLDVPKIESNQEDGTIKLVHRENFITEILEKYKIYRFGKAFPNAQSEILRKTYSISTNNRGLIKELSEKVSNEVFWFEPSQLNLNIIKFDDELIEYFKKETTYKFAEFISITEGCLHRSDCPRYTDLKSEINIYYDENNDFLVFESKENTTCIQSYKINFKQIYNNDGFTRLIVWSIDSETNCLGGELYETCFLERTFLQTIRLYPLLELDSKYFILKGSTPIFSDNIFRLEPKSLSISNIQFLNSVKMIPNPVKNLLSISQPQENKISVVSIFNCLGKKLMSVNNSFHKINTSLLSPGIYIVQMKAIDGTIIHKKIVKE